MMSFPARACTTSSPPLASMTSSPPVPLMWSGPFVPTMVGLAHGFEDAWAPAASCGEPVAVAASNAATGTSRRALMLTSLANQQVARAPHVRGDLLREG